MKPDRCSEVQYVDEVTGDDFDAICQACKRKMLAECGKDDAGDSSPTASAWFCCKVMEDMTINYL